MITVNVPYIVDKADNDVALARIRDLWDAEEGTAEFAELEVLTILVRAFERKAYPIDPPTPQALVESLMHDKGLSQTALVPIFGTSSRISEFLAGKRALSKDQAVRLHVQYGLPLELLLSVYDLLTPDDRTKPPAVSKKTSQKRLVPTKPDHGNIAARRALGGKARTIA